MNTRRAFTLVELLVVIVIIGILAALITVAVAGAMRSSHRASIGVQMNQIAMALEHYRAEFGEYPPDMFDDEALVRHVRKRWPRYNAPTAQQIRNAITAAYAAAGFTVDFADTNPNAPLGALALWLGGLPNADGRLSGFNADPENPFTLTGTFDGRAFIDWEVGNAGSNKSVRIINYGGGYVPVIGNEVRGTFVPIVYFRGRAGGGDGAYRLADGSIKQLNLSGLGWCVPYAEDAVVTRNSEGGIVSIVSIANIRWHNPTTYQLIHPGLDGVFGDVNWGNYVIIDGIMTTPRTGRVVKTGDGIELQDLDNLTNFSDYRELRSILP